MATSPEALIKALLFTQLDGCGGCAAQLPRAYPNLKFTPPKDGKWLRLDFILGRLDRIAIGSGEKHRQQGLLQASIMWPLDKGTDAPTDVAAEVIRRFPADLKLWEQDQAVSVRITQRPAMGPALIDETSLMVPVTVEWEAFI